MKLILQKSVRSDFQKEKKICAEGNLQTKQAGASDVQITVATR
jgi:hypothetical protein